MRHLRVGVRTSSVNLLGSSAPGWWTYTESMRHATLRHGGLVAGSPILDTPENSLETS